MNEVRGIILAAGASSRMGQPKALLTIDGETLIARAVRILTEVTGVAPIVVIGAWPLIAEAAGVVADVQIVMNPHWQAGPGTSIRCGVAACDADVLVIMPCDLPRVTASDLRRLIDALQPPATASAASFEGTIGPPACFDRSWFDRLLSLNPSLGMKQHLLDAGDAVARIAMPSAALDVDTPEEFNHERTM